MRMMDELKHLYLYSAKKKVYIPIDDKDRKKNSAIMLLTTSLEKSVELTKLPYIYNPGLFSSFYINRDVMAYIGNDIDIKDFDENEEESISEAMVSSSGKTKFRFEDGTSIMDKKYIEKVFNHRTVSKYSKVFRLGRIPEEIKVFVHPNKSSLQKDASKDLLKLHKDRLYSYSKNNEIHVISKLAYDEELMGGPYELYLTTELLCSIIMQYNPNTHFIPAKAISSVISKQYKWKLENDNDMVEIAGVDKLCKVIKIAEDKKDINIVSKYIKTADINVFKKYAASIVISDIKSLLFESALSYFERQRLLPSEFGIPDKRKYPMPDEEHVRLAIRLFNNCDYDEEEELAKAIIKKIDKFGIKDVKVSAANRFRKYYNPQKVNESFVNSQYADILKICSHLSGDEFKKISFYDTYRDSQFVIKRIIKYVGGEPAGFLDVYLFPSKPDIAQIVIAVDERFRGLRVADTMVKELLSSDLDSKYNFSVYYWTAHFDNEASQNLALKNGFVDTNTVDKYGRKVYILSVRQNEDVIPDIDRESFISNEFAVLNEANDNSTYKLKQYLYAERIKNNTEVLKMYDKVKSLNPNITRTYNRLEMYKGFNLFVDLSYYHSLYLKNSTYKYDKAVSFYFDFINKMINNDSINSMYKKQTIFIPVEGWPVQPMSDMTDFRKNLNPISIILRLIRTDSQALRTAWKNKDIIFVGSKGYFKIDFNLLETKDINRLKTNIKKLTTVGEVIEDDYELDDMDDNEDTSKAISAKIVDKIDKGTGINVSVTSTDDVESISKASLLSYDHLEMIPNSISIDNMKVDDGIILLVNPEDEEIFKESIITESFSCLNNFEEETPETIFSWMIENISYDSSNNWKLKTPDELYKIKKGNCHDQAWFLLSALKHISKPCGTLFFIEYNENDNSGGRTHTLVWYNTRGKLYWPETSWGGQQKIHGPFNDLKELKEYIEKIHSNEPESKKYPLLQWSKVGKLEAGIDLGEYVSRCLG